MHQYTIKLYQNEDEVLNRCMHVREFNNIYAWSEIEAQRQVNPSNMFWQAEITQKDPNREPF